MRANQFERVHPNDIPIVDDLLTLNSLLIDLDLVDGIFIGKLFARWSVKNLQIGCFATEILQFHILRYTHQCSLLSFSFPYWATLFNRTFNLEWELTGCKERAERVYPRKVHQVKKTLLDKLDFFDIKYRCQQNIFRKLAMVDFESNCVQEGTFKDTTTTT